jgi:DNA-binding GntR family transcriptional regulator
MDALSPSTRHERQLSRKRKETSRPRPKGSVQDGVYSELRRRLMLGEFLPGQVVTLRALASELGVSPMPVREAVNHLIAEGGFEMRHGRLVGVPRMTRERLIELLAARCAIEGIATEQACRKMSEKDLARLDAIHNKVMRSLDGKNPARALLLNQQFHFSLYAIAASTVFMPIIEALWLQAGPFMHLALSSPAVRWDGTHHVELMQALHRRDPAAARRAIVRDIEKSAQYLLKVPLLGK